mgnify:CR=1 FL=1
MIPPFALIIPSLDGDTEPLLAAVARQTRQPAEVVVVRGVRPNGHARNRGVAQTRSPLLVFLDDDAMPGHPELFERLLEPLRDPLVGDRKSVV